MPTMHLPRLGSSSLATLISRSLLANLFRDTETGLPGKDKARRLKVAPTFVAMDAEGQYKPSLVPGVVPINDMLRVT